MDVKKCDVCGSIAEEDDDPNYEWWLVVDGLERPFSTNMKAEVCSQACLNEWVDWRLKRRAELQKELEETSA